MMRQETLLSLEERRVLDALMDALLPGGNGFPAATQTGMGALLAARLTTEDPGAVAQLVVLADTGAGLPVDAPGWREVAYRIEVLSPKQFDAFRKQTYLAYYEQALVIEAIRALGLQYNDKPLPEGYPGTHFEPERDTPSHQRGKWIPTHAVKRVDLSGLDLGDVA